MKPTSPSLHPSAAIGFVQGAGSYVRGRPGYPAELSGWLRAALQLQAGKTALDLGAGTGKFLPVLLATGAAAIAVEPVAAMRERLAAEYPQVRAVDGSAETTGLADAAVDAVVCATAFHWFATRAALDEIHRVLRPGGWLGLVWNVRDERVPWVARLGALVNAFQRDTPRQASGDWRRVFPHAGFAPLQQSEFVHEHRGPADIVVLERVLSTSFIAALPQGQRAQVQQAVAQFIASEAELAGKAEVAVPYRCMAYAAQRIGGAG
ncbi:class I SAM-dependent methyltransferase [Tahibacter harae]|uniref:Class I SAM-dependent methyltransferase n=1 Tax=Tahibacter harae TaxID=2963937 RepID=A0ABT1QWC5_9GAMM|nr:class I SAM-dependent methyltransferase [Tahibacter harae]MCQ4166569.1 class I SAM-dependent methyltransferase [Tahibacter harae]